MNTFGDIFRLTDFGESHGPAMGGVIDGVPSRFLLDLDEVQREVDTRRPGQSDLVTPRRETDRVQFLSGLTESGVTLGTPIGFIIPNENQRSGDYADMEGKYRPNHADYTYMARYGITDWRGGGRSSARQTVTRVVAGAVAQQFLRAEGITVTAWLDPAVTKERILDAKNDGDSIGGLVHCTVSGMPPGIGDPVYGKLQARLAAAMLGINAVKGFDYGQGFAAADAKGSECIDTFTTDSEGRVTTLSNHSGGIQGGITNGADITMRVAFKPTPTLLRPLQTVDTEGREVTLQSRGRHDPCVAVRGVAVVKAMAAMVCFDALLRSRQR